MGDRATLPAPWWSTLWCRFRGHWWVVDGRGRPVTVFALCARCGKQGPRLVSEPCDG